jgi:hypothetical protein
MQTGRAQHRFWLAREQGGWIEEQTEDIGERTEDIGERTEDIGQWAEDIGERVVSTLALYKSELGNSWGEMLKNYKNACKNSRIIFKKIWKSSIKCPQ